MSNFVLAEKLRQPARRIARLRSAHWKDHSKLFIIHDIKTWVIAWEMKELSKCCKQLRIPIPHPFWMPLSERQCIFYGSQFFLLNDDWLSRTHRVATAWFHGKPGMGDQTFDDLFSRVQQHHERISSIQVSHQAMYNVACSTGIDPAKIHRIPIGINPSFFSPQTPELKSAAREKLDIPKHAITVGSFQKDGVGWGEGREPKMIKGPDVFVQAMKILKEKIPELHVVLSGPSRGYVKQALHDAGIPFTHHLLDNYPEIESLYHTLDAYVVASREEGGPKAILESMACGIPLITTRVGQAADLVTHQSNACIVEVEDAEGLAHSTQWVLGDNKARKSIRDHGLKTAAQHSYANQQPLWEKFFTGFVDSC